MSHSHPRTNSPSGQFVSMLLLVIVAATVGFGLGRESGVGQTGTFGVVISPSAPGVAYAAFTVHDDSVPDAAGALSHESLRDEDITPTF